MIIGLKFAVGLVVTDGEDVAFGVRYSHLPNG